MPLWGTPGDENASFLRTTNQ